MHGTLGGGTGGVTGVPRFGGSGRVAHGCRGEATTKGGRVKGVSLQRRAADEAERTRDKSDAPTGKAVGSGGGKEGCSVQRTARVRSWVGAK